MVNKFPTNPNIIPTPARRLMETLSEFGDEIYTPRRRSGRRHPVDTLVALGLATRIGFGYVLTPMGNQCLDFVQTRWLNS